MRAEPDLSCDIVEVTLPMALLTLFDDHEILSLRTYPRAAASLPADGDARGVQREANEACPGKFTL